METFALGFVVKEHKGAPALALPFRDLGVELLPPRLVQHEVGRIKNAQGVVMNGGGEVLHQVGLGRPRGDRDLHGHVRLAFDGHHNVVRRQIVAHPAQGRTGLTELQNEARALQLAHAALVIQIKNAQGLDLVIEQLHAQRFVRLPGIQVKDAATPCELAAFRDLGHTLVAGLLQFLGEGIHIQPHARLEEAALGFHLREGRHLLVQRLRAQHHEPRLALGLAQA